MPRHLAWFPIEMIEKIRDKQMRNDLKHEWKEALKMLEKYGEEYSPVVAVQALKSI